MYRRLIPVYRCLKYYHHQNHSSRSLPPQQKHLFVMFLCAMNCSLPQNVQTANTRVSLSKILSSSEPLKSKPPTTTETFIRHVFMCDELFFTTKCTDG